jgi:hypothetical protein
MPSSSKEAIILLVISFLATALIFSSSSNRFVQAVPVWGPAGEKKCTIDYSPFLPTRSCCWIDTDTEAYKKFCEVCTYQPDGTYGDCKTTEGPVAFTPKQPPITTSPSAGNAQPPSSTPPPSNALPPSSSALPSQSKQQTTTCPDGSTPDANGKCPSTTTTNEQVAPTQHHHKGSNLGQTGETTTTKKSKVPSQTDHGTTQSP